MKETKTKADLINRGLTRIRQLLDIKLKTEHGFFIINHLYSLIEVDNYHDNSKSIRRSNQDEKNEILKILKQEFYKKLLN